MLSCVPISYTHEWDILRSQHFLPFKKEVLQCDNASIMTSHLRMLFAFPRFFLAPEKYFILIAIQTKWLLILFFFSPKVKHDSSCLSLHRTAERGWLLISRPFKALGKLWQQWGAWLKTACHGFVSNTNAQCAYVFIYLNFCNVYTHTYRYFYRCTSTYIWIYLTPQTSSLCSGRCFADHRSMGWKIK